MNSSPSVEDFIPLNMTKDRKTEMYIKFAKVMVIFQGKETEKRTSELCELEGKFKTCGRILSDKTYKKENNTFFSLRNADDYHNYFRSYSKRACEDNCNLIVVSQSVLDDTQVKYYMYLAQTMQYVVLVVPPLIINYDVPQKRTDNQAAAIKCIPDWIKYQNYFTHHFCGWFFHDVDSSELRTLACLYVKDCFEHIDVFNTFFSKICDADNYAVTYNMTRISRDLAYCMIAVFSGQYKASDYFKEDLFKKYYGKISKLYIVGFLISPYVVAARVKLTNEQKRLWQLEGVETFLESPSKLLHESKVDLPNEEINLVSSKCNCTIQYDKDIEDPVNILYQSRAASCHILLGKVDDVSFEHLDCDVFSAVKREQAVGKKFSHEVPQYELPNSVVRKIGQFWFVYLKKTIFVNGFFSSCTSVHRRK